MKIGVAQVFGVVIVVAGLGLHILQTSIYPDQNMLWMPLLGVGIVVGGTINDFITVLNRENS